MEISHADAHPGSLRNVRKEDGGGVAEGEVYTALHFLAEKFGKAVRELIGLLPLAVSHTYGLGMDVDLARLRPRRPLQLLPQHRTHPPQPKPPHLVRRTASSHPGRRHAATRIYHSRRGINILVRWTVHEHLFHAQDVVGEGRCRYRSFSLI